MKSATVVTLLLSFLVLGCLAQVLGAPTVPTAAGVTAQSTGTTVATSPASGSVTSTPGPSNGSPGNSQPTSSLPTGTGGTTPGGGSARASGSFVTVLLPAILGLVFKYLN